MDPNALVGPASSLGSPAPYWFLVLFKVLGFTLHWAPMSVWFAGTLTALILGRSKNPHGRRLSARLMGQLPLIIAAGVNLGIVPLLFLQVAYHRVFYPATILMAWPWLSIIALLCVAYYGAYVYAIGLKRGGKLNGWTRAAGWTSAVFFIVIGYIFVVGLQLMTNVGEWPALLEATSVGGAPLGTALTGGMLAGTRFLMVFGIAAIVTGAYLLFDAGVLAGRETQEYRDYARKFAFHLASMGLLMFALGGGPYFFVAIPEQVRAAMFSGPRLLFSALSMLLPVAVWLITLLAKKNAAKSLAILGGLVAFLALSVNAIARQLVQNLELAPYMDAAAAPLNPQWDTLILFLVLFVAGVGVILWMVAQVVKVNRREMAARKG